MGRRCHPSRRHSVGNAFFTTQQGCGLDRAIWGEDVLCLFLFFQLMLLKVLWFSVMLTTLTEPDTLPLLDNHSKSRVSKRGKQNMLG